MQPKLLIKPLVFALVLLIAIAGIIFFFPPKYPLLVYIVILLIGLATYLLLGSFLRRKRALIIFIIVLLFLSVNYLVGFNLLNTGLLVCLLIALNLLLK